MTQAFITIVVPFRSRRETEVNDYLDTLGNVAGQDVSANPPRGEVLTAEQLRELGEFVHFVSILVVPKDGHQSAFLVIELSADGPPGMALERLAAVMREELCHVIDATGNDPCTTQWELLSFLKAHRVAGGTGVLSSTLELDFEGTPGMTVSRIRDEARLAEWIRDCLNRIPLAASAMAKLGIVREEAFKDVRLKWAFVSEPVRLLDEPKPRLDLTKALLTSAWRDFLWPLIPLPIAFGLWSSCFRGHTFDRAMWILALVLGLELLIVGIALFIAYGRLRRKEEDDVPFDIEPEAKLMKEILERENQPGVAQNHLFAVSTLKPGRVRRTSLRIALWLVGELSRGRSRPGFLDKIGTIHFARWILLPGTDRLLFLSNYDGSWQSYLEDFIARLRQGLTSIWSNTRDFPKTANLITGGVADGARFKRWARRQQQPTRFWYSAYPQLTTERIRTNAAIRHGFAAASNEGAAAKWLALFGYPEPESIEKDEISALAFGGLRFFDCAHCLIVHFGKQDQARAWLKSVRDDLGYGEHTELAKSTMVAAFTCDGLHKLGLDKTALDTFPNAFQQGMSAPERSRALGDEDSGDWWWGDDGRADAALIVYAGNVLDDGNVKDPHGQIRRRQGLRAQVLKQTRELRAYGHSVLLDVPLRDLSVGDKEPFGFKDGISQPKLRGSKHWSEPEFAMHVVEPGELVLGYRDNLGNVSPSPSSQGQDIGRNGTFLVIRQLEQHTAKFDKYVAKEAARLAADPRAPNFAGGDMEHWVAARMVGRWRDGSSLVRNTHPPSTLLGAPARSPDNDFQYGRDDPDGLRCPLGAHVRRANPRDSFEPGSPVQLAITNRHRILRVGRMYEPELRRDPGLLFMCINADIERQFEFVQQTWLLGPNFHGLDDEIDPVVGFRSVKDAMTVPTPQGPLRLEKLAKFVKMRGGGYFFIPGKSTIRTLAS